LPYRYIELSKKYAPALIFLLIAVLSYGVFHVLAAREQNHARDVVEQETGKIEQLVTTQTSAKLLALKRMAQRWDSAGGTPYNQWNDDARNYVGQISGLQALAWVDSSDKIRWIVTGQPDGYRMGQTIVPPADSARPELAITPPLDLGGGPKGFIAYAPIHLHGSSGGFIMGVFSLQPFLQAALTDETADHYAVFLSYQSQVFYRSPIGSNMIDPHLAAERRFPILDKEWTLRVVPTRNFVKSQLTALPESIFIGGLLIAGLMALTFHYLLMARAQSALLRSSEETFRSAMEYAPIGMALVSLEGRWLRANAALTTLLGYSAKELLAMDFQKITFADDLAANIENARRLIAGDIQSYQMDKRYIHKDGHILWAKLSVSLARTAEGAPAYFISQIQDVTQQHEIDRMKSEFISIVSHELRTPLTSIRGALGLVTGTMAQALPEKANSLLGIAYRNSERLILLINDILDLDKISAGQMRFDLMPEDVSTLIQAGDETNAPYAERFKVRYAVGPLPQECFIKVDAGRWQQVFSNLLSNAAKFSPEGSAVDIGIRRENGMVKITVMDKGQGIPEEFRPRIFGKFSQAADNASRSKGGTGLGLNISREIVTRMHGEIGFDSMAGQGTTFWFTFPECPPLSS
jgi:PAS domain S-box-containing protein